jgi:hypothetical protein
MAAVSKQPLKPNKNYDDINKEIACLEKQFTSLCIDIAPYIEKYVLENYFKLYTLKNFQKEGLFVFFLI